MTGPVKSQSGLANIAPYVPGRPVEEVRRELGLTDVIKLASNENPMAPSPKALAAMASVLSQVNSYPDSNWYELRHALAARLGVSPDQVTLGNGIDGLITELSLAYLDEGDEVVVSESSFPLYDTCAKAMRARVVKTPLKDYCLDLEAMGSALTDRTKLIYVCNPNNPTGTIVTEDEVTRFMKAVPGGVLVVFDEAYYEFVGSSAYPDTLRYVHEGRRNVLVFRTFSKVYGLAGARLGYGVAHPDVLAPMNKIREPFAVSMMAQAAGIGALDDDDYLRRSVAANAAGRAYLCGEFERLGLLYAESHTNFVLVQVGPKADAVQQKLLESGVIVRPCHGYGLAEFMRITIGDGAQNKRLIASLEAALGKVARRKVTAHAV